jgi:hypothetical protein
MGLALQGLTAEQGRKRPYAIAYSLMVFKYLFNIALEYIAGPLDSS